MFGIGTSELIVVAVLALLLFSPRELPKILRSVSQLWGTLRRTADEFRDAIMQEEAMQDLKDAVEGTKAQLRDAEGAARRELMKARMEARRAENKLVKVARERERIEREAAAEGDGEAKGDGAAAKPAEAGAAAATARTAAGVDAGASTPGGIEAAAPTGTVPAGSTAVRHPSAAEADSPPRVTSPKTVDPRHAGPAATPSSGDAPKPESSANQGAA